MTDVISLADRRSVRPIPPHEADTLSFMRRRKGGGGGIDYWHVRASGKYSADCETGQKLAAEYLAFLAEYPTNGNMTLLQCIVSHMVKSGQWNGVCVGFLRTVNECASIGAYHLRHPRGGG